jgi:hypothetical protein
LGTPKLEYIKQVKKVADPVLKTTKQKYNHLINDIMDIVVDKKSFEALMVDLPGEELGRLDLIRTSIRLA